jgi:hypothetical protein
VKLRACGLPEDRITVPKHVGVIYIYVCGLPTDGTPVPKHVAVILMDCVS